MGWLYSKIVLKTGQKCWIPGLEFFEVGPFSHSAEAGMLHPDKKEPFSSLNGPAHCLSSLSGF